MTKHSLTILFITSVAMALLTNWGVAATQVVNAEAHNLQAERAVPAGGDTLIYLPIMFKAIPIPDTPVLNPINNPTHESIYTVTWTEEAWATAYILEEDDNQQFNSPTVVYDGDDTSWTTPTQRPSAVYYYRVVASNPSGDSDFSNTVSIFVTEFWADDDELNVGECTTLRWDYPNIQAIYISFGNNYDFQGVGGTAQRTVCPGVTTTYTAQVVRSATTTDFYEWTIDVTGSGCGNNGVDPIIERFAPTTTEVNPGELFSIFWDVECVQAVYLTIGNTPEQPVEGHGSLQDINIFTTTEYQLRVVPLNQGDEPPSVYSRFIVTVR